MSLNSIHAASIAREYLEQLQPEQAAAVKLALSQERRAAYFKARSLSNAEIAALEDEAAEETDKNAENFLEERAFYEQNKRDIEQALKEVHERTPDLAAEVNRANLKITEIQVYPISWTAPNNGRAKLRAIARIVLNDALQLTGLRIYRGVKGLFVSYPNDISRPGEEYHQVYYPVISGLRSEIERAILEEYQKSI